MRRTPVIPQIKGGDPHPVTQPPGNGLPIIKSAEKTVQDDNIRATLIWLPDKDTKTLISE